MKRVVLVRPSGPRNVGMVLRIVENFGPAELWLVAPERPSLLVHPEFEQMSHGAEEAAAAIRVVATLPEALADAHEVVGFTARGRDNQILADWRDVRAELAERAADPERRVALLFGNEQTGLTGEEAALCHSLVHIRTSPRHTSLNLAVSVGIVLEALFSGEVALPREAGGHPIDGRQREFLKRRMIEVFARRVARTPQAALDVEAMLERAISRAPLDTRDARAWHLVLRALGSTSTPADLGVDGVDARE